MKGSVNPQRRPWRGQSRAQRTVNVPSIPARRCPGTEQKKAYLPARSFARAVVVVAWTVLVLARVLFPSAIVTSCGTGASFTNLMVIAPADAPAPPQGPAVWTALCPLQAFRG